MSKIDAEMLAYLFEINYNVIKKQTDGLTHEDSLLQLPFRGNCLNWVMGHLLISRDSVLERLGEERIWSKEQSAMYDYGSDPITEENSDSAVHFDQIMADYERSHQCLMAALKRTTEEDLEVVPEGRKANTGKWLAFMQFHDAYHTGQTEYLRQLAGKDDKVI